MMKSEGTMSELLSNVLKENENEDVKTKMSKIGKSFLNNREVSAQESAYRILGLPLKYCTRVTVFINTSVPEKRVRLLKPASSLAQMNCDETDVFYKNMIDRYESRTDCLENLCLAEFAATYNSNSSSDDTEDLNVEDRQDVDDFLNLDSYLSFT